MDKSEFDMLMERVKESTTIQPAELADQSDRLLVDGYEADRSTFKLYLEAGQFVLRFFTYEDRDLAPVAWRTTEGEPVEAELLYPRKRVYPETSDYAFMRLLRSRGALPSFASWDQKRYDYHHA